MFIFILYLHSYSRSCKYYSYKGLRDSLERNEPQIYNKIVLEKFPEKVPKSVKLLSGMKMSDAAVVERCGMLGDWMKGLIKRFTYLNVDSRAMIVLFFCLDASHEVDAHVINMLDAGKIDGSKAANLVIGRESLDSNSPYQGEAYISGASSVANDALPPHDEKVGRKQPKPPTQRYSEVFSSSKYAPGAPPIPNVNTATATASTEEQDALERAERERKKIIERQSYARREADQVVIMPPTPPDAEDEDDSGSDSDDEYHMLVPSPTQKQLRQLSEWNNYNGNRLIVRTFCMTSMTGHALYTTAMRYKRGYKATKHKLLKSYQELRMKLDEEGLDDMTLGVDFPVAYSSVHYDDSDSLSKEELKLRNRQLDAWVRKLLYNYHEIVAVDTIKQILVNFFELYEADYEVKPVLDKLCIGDVHPVLQTPPEDLDEKSIFGGESEKNKAKKKSMFGSLVSTDASSAPDSIPVSDMALMDATRASLDDDDGDDNAIEASHLKENFMHHENTHAPLPMPPMRSSVSGLQNEASTSSSKKSKAPPANYLAISVRAVRPNENSDVTDQDENVRRMESDDTAGSTGKPLYETTLRLVELMDPSSLHQSNEEPLYVYPCEMQPFRIVGGFNAYKELHALIDKQQRASGVGVALPPFPNTYGKSFFYTKLTEEELQERVMMLEKWIRELLLSYAEFPDESRDTVMKFLGFSDNDTAQYEIYDTMVRHGKVLFKKEAIIDRSSAEVPIAPNRKFKESNRRSYHVNPHSNNSKLNDPTTMNMPGGCGCLPSGSGGIFGFLFGSSKQSTDRDKQRRRSSAAGNRGNDRPNRRRSSTGNSNGNSNNRRRSQQRDRRPSTYDSDDDL